MIRDRKIYINKEETWDDINGSRLESGYEVNGIKEGIWEYYDPESEILIEKATYKSGMRHGKAYIFLAMDKWNYEDENKVNRVWHERIYKNDDLYQDISFHKDGGYQVEHLKNGKKHGMRLNIVAKVAERTNEKLPLNISTSTISRISII